MYTRLLLSGLLFFFAASIIAQIKPATLECGATNLPEYQKYKRQLDSLEVSNGLALDKDFATLRSKSFNPPPYILPVVFHVIHNGGSENLPEIDLQRSFDYLNQSFANTEYYDQGIGVDTRIQFCLAQRTPDNLPTNGITYHQSPLTDITAANDLNMKDLARWNPLDYINIYVVRDICLSSCNVAGYAYLPSAHGLGVDGIVVEARWLAGDEADASVLTHEIGHYLGLYHTFEGGCTNNDCTTDGDRVCDTPPDQSTVAVPCDGEVNTCSTDTDSGFTTDQNDQFNNYMDYGYWGCYNMLTQGQSDRMYFFIDGIRQSLLNSSGCLSPCPDPVVADFTYPSGNVINIDTEVTFTNTGNGPNGFEWYLDEILISTTADLTYLFDQEGTFELRLVAVGDVGICLPAEFMTRIVVTCSVSASFDVPNNELLPGSTINLTANDLINQTYSWALNGNNIGNSNSVDVTFSSPGIYELCLSVNTDNCTAEDCKFFFVNSPPDPPNGGVCLEDTYLSIYSLDMADIVTGTAIALGNSSTLWQSGVINNPDGERLLILQQVNPVNGMVMNSVSLSTSPLVEVYGIFTIRTLSDGTLLLAVNGEDFLGDRKSMIIRYDPVSQMEVYRRITHYDGLIYDLYPIPDEVDRFLAIQNQSLSASANGSDELWLFDVDGMSGEIMLDWNYQSAQTGAHTIIHGIFHQGSFKGTGRIAITPVSSTFRPCIMNFGVSNNVNSLQLFHRSANQSARLYGQQIIAIGDVLYTIHTGNRTGTNLNNGNFTYFSRWNTQDEIEWTREIKVPGSRVFTVLGTRYANGLFYSVGSWVDSQGTDHFFVMAFTDDGEVIWSNTYTLESGKLAATTVSVYGNIVLTDNNLLIPITLRNSAQTIDRGFGLLCIDLVGSLNDDCVDIEPINVTIAEVETTQELFSLSSRTLPNDGNLLQGFPGTPFEQQLYTGCEEICEETTDEDSDEICGNGIDDDGNGFTDCNDPALINTCCCAMEPMVSLPADTIVCANDPFIIQPVLSGEDFMFQWSTTELTETITVATPGTYTLTVTDSCGRTAIDEITVGVRSPLTFPDLGPDFFVCDNGVFELDAGPGYTSYLWSDLTIGQEATFFGEGTYWVRVTNTCGEVATDTIVIDLFSESLINLPDTLRICPGDSSELVTTGFTDLQWFSGDILTCRGCQDTFIQAPPPGDTVFIVVVAGNENGCFSSDSTYAIMEDTGGNFIEATICAGEQYFFNGTSIDISGTYTVDAFCGTTDTLILTVLPIIQPRLTFDSICSNDSIFLFNEYRFTSGTYLDTLVSITGCDSVLQVDLTVFDQPTSSTTITICSGDSTLIFGDFAFIAGTYQQSFPQEGQFCDSIATVVLSVVDLPDPEINLDFSCGDDIALVTMTGLTADVVINWEGPNLIGTELELPNGIYPVTFIRSGGCELERIVEINIPAGFELTLPHDTVLRLGDEFNIRSQLYGLDPADAIFRWTPADYLDCDSCATVTAQPAENIDYELSVTDSLGCIRQETIQIRLDKRERIFVPNGFSPNGDGVNDVFLPSFGPEVVNVEFIQIYDRWGGMVYEVANVAPNAPTTSWNGMRNGEPLDSGIFVYLIRARLLDGRVVKVSGDVALLR